MQFSSSKDALVNVTTLSVERVKEIQALNRAGKKVDSIVDKDEAPLTEEPTFRTGEDSITRFDNLGKRRKNRGRKDQRRQDKAQPDKVRTQGDENTPANDEQAKGGNAGNNNGRNRNERRN